MHEPGKGEGGVPRPQGVVVAALA
eukprot:SAG31_NODE_32956_length_349_cov_1.644000_1_plen_23_part_01